MVTLLDSVLGDDFQAFLIHLSGTIQLCTSRLPTSTPGITLRTPLLSPDPFASNGKAIVRSVMSRRRYYFSELNKTPATSLAKGRLLVYWPNGNLADGASANETNGFFDVDNIPPWDTWVAYFYESGQSNYQSNYLVSWIPEVFIELASSGIEVNPEQCISWLDEVKDSPILRLLQEAAIS